MNLNFDRYLSFFQAIERKAILENELDEDHRCGKRVWNTRELLMEESVRECVHAYFYLFPVKILNHKNFGGDQKVNNKVKSVQSKLTHYFMFSRCCDLRIWILSKD